MRPNVFLPDAPDSMPSMERVSLVVKQEEATLRLEKARAFERIVTGMPMISARQDMEIAGKQAKLRLHTGDLEFYFRTADERDPRLKLVRAQIKDGKRELEVVSTDIAGQQKYKDQEISLLKWDAARGLYRFTLDHPLEAGEYAAIETIETTTSEGQSIYVWTFGVDGDANDAWREAEGKTTPQRSKGSRAENGPNGREKAANGLGHVLRAPRSKWQSGPKCGKAFATFWRRLDSIARPRPGPPILRS